MAISINFLFSPGPSLITERTFLKGQMSNVDAIYRAGKCIQRNLYAGDIKIGEIDLSHDSFSCRYMHLDGVTSVRLTSNNKGEFDNQYSYSVYGSLKSEQKDEVVSGYVGGLGVEMDPTGLLFMRNRYFSPKIGRFIQRDPTGFYGLDVNLYRYCWNDAISFVDPLGTVGTVTQPINSNTMNCKQARIHLENSFNKPSAVRPPIRPVAPAAAAGGAGAAGAGGTMGTAAAGAGAFALGFGAGVFLDGVQCGVRGKTSWYSDKPILGSISRAGENVGTGAANTFSHLYNNHKI